MNQYQCRLFGLSISFDTETLLIRGINPLHVYFHLLILFLLLTT